MDKRAIDRSFQRYSQDMERLTKSLAKGYRFKVVDDPQQMFLAFMHHELKLISVNIAGVHKTLEPFGAMINNLTNMDEFVYKFVCGLILHEVGHVKYTPPNSRVNELAIEEGIKSPKWWYHFCINIVDDSFIQNKMRQDYPGNFVNECLSYVEAVVQGSNSAKELAKEKELSVQQSMFYLVLLSYNRQLTKPDTVKISDTLIDEFLSIYYVDADEERIRLTLQFADKLLVELFDKSADELAKKLKITVTNKPQPPGFPGATPPINQDDSDTDEVTVSTHPNQQGGKPMSDIDMNKYDEVEVEYDIDPNLPTPPQQQNNEEEEDDDEQSMPGAGGGGSSDIDIDGPEDDSESEGSGAGEGDNDDDSDEPGSKGSSTESDEDSDDGEGEEDGKGAGDGEESDEEGSGAGGESEDGEDSEGNSDDSESGGSSTSDGSSNNPSDSDDSSSDKGSKAIGKGGQGSVDESITAEDVLDYMEEMVEELAKKDLSESKGESDKAGLTNNSVMDRTVIGSNIQKTHKASQQQQLNRMATNMTESFNTEFKRIQAFTFNRTVYNLPAGKFSPRDAYRTSFTKNVFNQRFEPKRDMDLFCGIDLDCSGSMRWSNVGGYTLHDVMSDIIQGLLDSLTQVKAKTEVLGFDTRTVKIKDYYAPYEPLSYYSALKRSINQLGGGTDMFDSLNYFKHAFKMKPHKDKALIIFTDGATNNVNECAEIITELSRQKVLVIGIGLNLEYGELDYFDTLFEHAFHKNYTGLTDIKVNIAKDLREKLSETFMKNKI